MGHSPHTASLDFVRPPGSCSPAHCTPSFATGTRPPKTVGTVSGEQPFPAGEDADRTPEEGMSIARALAIRFRWLLRSGELAQRGNRGRCIPRSVYLV